MKYRILDTHKLTIRRRVLRNREIYSCVEGTIATREKFHEILFRAGFSIASGNSWEKTDAELVPDPDISDSGPHICYVINDVELPAQKLIKLVELSVAFLQEHKFWIIEYDAVNSVTCFYDEVLIHDDASAWQFPTQQLSTDILIAAWGPPTIESESASI
jgi:hypothetical protein